MNIYGCSANLSGYMPYSCFFHSRNRTRKYKNRQSVCRSMGIDTGVRLSATNGHRISSSFQKFQDFMPFPIEKYRMECFHHLHSFRLSTYSIYLWPRWNPLFLILLYRHLDLCHWHQYVAPYHPIPLLLFIVQLSILMPFYLGSLFVPFLLIPGMALTTLLSCQTRKHLKRLLW